MRRLSSLFEWRHLRTGVFIASVLESTVVPVPLEILLIPAMASNRKRIWGMATAALLGCLVGAAFWYLLGATLFDSAGAALMEWVAEPGDVERYTSKVQNNGFWVVFAGGITPTPFQVVTAVAGIVRYSLPLFILACVSSRALRYFGLGGLVTLLGDRAEAWWKNHRALVIAGSFLLLGVLFGLTKLLERALVG